MLQDEYLLVTLVADTTENGPNFGNNFANILNVPSFGQVWQFLERLPKLVFTILRCGGPRGPGAARGPARRGRRRRRPRGPRRASRAPAPRSAREVRSRKLWGALFKRLIYFSARRFGREILRIPRLLTNFVCVQKLFY